MQITIVGAGNAGIAHAAMMTRAGHHITLLKTTNIMHEDTFQEISKTSKITYIRNNEEHIVDNIDITRDFQRGIKRAEIIYIMTQSIAHETLAKKIVPFLKPDQIVVVTPGYCGSFYFSTLCKGKDIIFVEGESQPFDARICGPGRVTICSENIRNPIGVFPSCKTGFVVEQLKKVLPRYTPRNNILESAFHNPNLIIHTIGAIMSVARIEHSQGNFWMYREAFTPSIWNLVHDLDKEKLAILKYFDLPQQTFLDSFHFRNYENLKADPMEAFLHYAKFGSPKGPFESKSRYITEDVPMGLCFMSSVGEKTRIPTPICDSLIRIASSIHQTDYYKKGRTLNNLGLGDYSKEKLKEILEFGFSNGEKIG